MNFLMKTKLSITFFRKAQIIFCAFWALFHMASSISKRSSGTFIHIWHGIIVANTVCASSLKIFHHYIHNKPIITIFFFSNEMEESNKDMNYDTYFSKEFWKMHYFSLHIIWVVCKSFENLTKCRVQGAMNV